MNYNQICTILKCTYMSINDYSKELFKLLVV